MLSFEEFFIKKKIDLFALKSADQELYAEFETHYHSMGEKSFDHSKKFWFNKLRKSYRLSEEIPAPKISATREDTSTLASVSTEVNTGLGFKPKFRPQQKNTESEPVSSKFKAAASKEEEKASGDVANPVLKDTIEDNIERAHKPAGFKPRFKAGVTKTTDTTPAVPESTPEHEVKDVSQHTSEAASKPMGFKPRFKASVTKTTDTTPAVPESTPEHEVKDVSQHTSEAASKPTGFKPRFKAGVTKTTDTTPAVPESTPEHEVKDVSQNTSEAASKPTGFKPRFKASVTKNTPPTDDKQ